MLTNTQIRDLVKDMVADRNTAAVSTSDNTPTSILSILTKPNTMGFLWCYLIGANASFGTHTTIAQAVYKNVAGVVTIVLAEEIVIEVSPSMGYASANYSGEDDTVVLKVTGIGESVNWKATYTLTEVEVPEAVV